MKLLKLIVAILAIIGLLSTLICGLWIMQQTNVAQSSINFHASIGIASVVLSIFTFILFLIKK